MLCQLGLTDYMYSLLQAIAQHHITVVYIRQLVYCEASDFKEWLLVSKAQHWLCVLTLVVLSLVLIDIQ